MFERGRDPMSVEKRCLDCDSVVTFPGSGDATCPECGLNMYMNDAGQIGRYPPADWDPGGIQGWRRSHLDDAR
jgi:hypothetical protein